MYSGNKLIPFFTGLLFCCSVFVSKAQVSPFYTVTPFEEDGYFSKTVFPFNPAFLKSNKVKSISLKYNDEEGMNYRYHFTLNGLLESMTAMRYSKEKTDTAFYTLYYYNANGLVDKKARIDYHDGIVTMSCYQYDEKNRTDIIRIFSLNSQMPNRLTNSDWQGEPAPFIDKTILQGGLPNESVLRRMTTEHEFSSWRYRYYTKDKFEAEERTEYYDFRKQNGNQDTCAQKITYYYFDRLPVALFLHTGCADKTMPSELYRYQEGLLAEKTDAPGSLEPKTEKYSYNKNKNLVLMEDIWNGEKVSELIMSYDKKGFLMAIQRKSAGAKAIHYFEDRVLKATYTFY
jgi:hypothetical protein